MSLARQMDTAAFQMQLRAGLDQGLSYAAARQNALGDDSGLLRQPNNILGLEYCRAIFCQGSNLTPLAVVRNGDYHAVEADREAPSATAIRALYPHGDWSQYLPEAAASYLRDAAWYALSCGERAMLARLRAMPQEEWEQCAHGSEGLWRKAMKAARSQSGYEEIVQAVKSKRYPRTRIQRLLLCAYLGIRDADLHQPIPYVRILAASEAGRRLLRTAKKEGSLPLMNPGEKPKNQDYSELERRAADLFTLFAAPGFPTPCGTEQTARLRI